MIVKLFFSYLSILFVLPVFSQNSSSYYNPDILRYEDYIYQQGIKTIRFHPTGDILGMPIIRLGAGEQLYLSFDDLYEDYVNYSYTVVHCDANWQPSNLIPAEYISGIQDGYINSYEYSLNTLIPYTNYRLLLPNANLDFTKSGNYVLIVYRDGNPEDLVFTRRFMIYEDLVNIGAEVKRATRVEYNDTHQEIDFIISHPNYQIQDPFQDLKVVIMQNQRWDNTLTGLKPQFVQNSTLLYQYDGENIFQGTNEYRWFDIKNLQTLTQNVRHISRDSVYTAYLAVDQPRSISRYAVFNDINGQYVVRRLDSPDSETEADYAYVDFQLDYPAPLEEGDLYIFGKITDWRMLPEYKLRYDYARNAYRAKVLLKQGYYNYMFAMPEIDGSAGLETIEGSHWEAENTYQILVYNRELDKRYDRLVGFQAFSSEALY